MGTYITHEGLPFHGALEKIRIRSCRVADLSLLHSPKHSRTIAGNASRQLVDIGVSGF